MLDTLHAIETPEGVQINLKVAGPVSRALALIIDSLIRSMAYIAFGSALLFMGEAGWGIFSIFAFFMEWFYFVLFEVYNKGQTPGKRIMGLEVIHEDGTPIGMRGAMLRNLLRAVDFLPFGFAFGLGSCLASARFQRLGDRVAGTLVIYRMLASPSPESIPQQPPLPPPAALSLTEQRAVISFGERAQTLPGNRAEELASHLEPLTHKQGLKAVEALYGFANWLVGTRR
ncbi:RDD family protein [Sulfidibacter corallicola]|uniref:RDD family protein n=1 Tax=Sulfidibacter corallicola TaxID=2818388 RepID=A0A8A4TQ17_SULCO|nr:RDD family protein [Sulfidibacter corallicola]QTD51011.1 RDD family protein [Sulfidibacter corallicola]